jgi:hypothetical protein
MQTHPRFPLRPTAAVATFCAGFGLLFAAGACATAGATPAVDPAPEAAHDHAHHGPAHAHETDGARVGDPYPLGHCPVSGEALGSMGEPVVVLHEGREIRFCCAGCAETFARDPDAHIARIDAEIVASQAPHYALEVCPVAGSALGEMGEPDEYVTGNRLVRLCCAGCRRGVDADRAAVIEQLDEAVKAAQRDAYPLDVCVVSGEALDDHGGAVEVVVAGRLVKVCCPGCARELQANPAPFLKALDEGRSVETPDAGDDRGHDDHGHHPHGH